MARRPREAGVRDRVGVHFPERIAEPRLLHHHGGRPSDREPRRPIPEGRRLPAERVDHARGPVAPRRGVEVAREEHGVSGGELRSERIEERLHPPDPDMALDLQDLGLRGRAQPHHVDGVGIRRVVDVRDRHDLARGDQQPAPEAVAPRGLQDREARDRVEARRRVPAERPRQLPRPAERLLEPHDVGVRRRDGLDHLRELPVDAALADVERHDVQADRVAAAGRGGRSRRRDDAGRDECEREDEDRGSAHVAEPSLPRGRMGRRSA